MLASCVAKGTVADGYVNSWRIARSGDASPPYGDNGCIDDYSTKGGEYINKSAGLVRTARKTKVATAHMPTSR